MNKTPPNSGWFGIAVVKSRCYLAAIALLLAPMSLFAGSDRVAELKNQLAAIETEESRELALVEQNVDQVVKQLTTEIETLKASLPDLQKQLTSLKAQSDPLRNQLETLQQERAAIENNYADKIAKASKASTEAREAAKEIKTNSLAAAAKLVNDAVIANNLKIDLVPRDGVYEVADQDKDAIPTGWMTARYWVGTIFEYQTDWDVMEKKPIVGQVLGLKGNQQGLGVKIVVGSSSVSEIGLGTSGNYLSEPA